MKTIYNLFVLTILTLPVSLPAQLVVNSDTLSTNELVQDVLAVQGLDVSNINFNGVNIQRGYFNGENSNIGINSGVIIATGDISVAVGPNDLDNVTEPMDSGCGTFPGPGGLCQPGDSDLDSILAGAAETHDAAVLEFDFIPQSDTIRLNYVFASEEYPEYVCSEYNDLFAFLLSGPNPAGGNYNKVNIARVPGATLPVAINTINSGEPGIGNGPWGCTGAAGSLAYSSLHNDNLFGTTVQFDGFTDKLEAFAHVIPCETYHVKITIADAGDGLYDSAVFLEENSFTTDIVDIDVAIVDTESNMETQGTTIAEGCDFIGAITFSLNTPAFLDYYIPYTVSGTAINGIDYDVLPATIFIPAGQTEVVLEVNPIEDTIEEGLETIIFEIQSSACETETFTITIDEEMPLSAPIMSCGLGDGITPNFQWESIPDATGYEVSEDGGLTWMSAFPGPLEHNFMGVVQGETATLLVRAIGGILFCVNNPASSLQCPSIGCEVAAEITAQTDVTCYGNNDGTATATLINGAVPFTYQWDANADNQFIPTAIGLGTGTYNVTVTDNVGCYSIATVQINEPPALEIFIFSDEEGSATVVAVGGVGVYSYQWNDPNMQTTPTAIGLESGTYTVTVTDENNCTTIAEIDLIVSVEPPEHLSNFEILPNPSTGTFTIALQFEVAQTATIEILNILGQEMYHFTDTQSDFLQTIDMREAAAGTYFVVIHTESGRVVRRVVLM